MFNRVDWTGEFWRPTFTEDMYGNRTFNGYEWIPDDEVEKYEDYEYGLYEQAIFFSDNGTFNNNSKKNIGSSTAYVYLADGTVVEFDACTLPSSFEYATVTEGLYIAIVGMHNDKYIALRMSDMGKHNSIIELGYPNPAYKDGRTYISGANIHKPGRKNFTGITYDGIAISEGCFLIDINRWDEFVNLFNTPSQRGNTVSITVSRTLSEPIISIERHSFNFIETGTWTEFYKLNKLK